MSYLDRLHHRPFLVVDLLSHPAKWARTERKGWHLEAGNLVTTDYPRIVQRISHTTMRTATVIIDLVNDRVIKNRHKADGTLFDDEVLTNCKQRYSQMIGQALQAVR